MTKTARWLVFFLILWLQPEADPSPEYNLAWGWLLSLLKGAAGGAGKAAVAVKGVAANVGGTVAKLAGGSAQGGSGPPPVATPSPVTAAPAAPPPTGYGAAPSPTISSPMSMMGEGGGDGQRGYGSTTAMGRRLPPGARAYASDALATAPAAATPSAMEAPRPDAGSGWKIKREPQRFAEEPTTGWYTNWMVGKDRAANLTPDQRARARTTGTLQMLSGVMEGDPFGGMAKGRTAAGASAEIQRRESVRERWVDYNKKQLADPKTKPEDRHAYEGMAAERTPFAHLPSQRNPYQRLMPQGGGMAQWSELNRGSGVMEPVPGYEPVRRWREPRSGPTPGEAAKARKILSDREAVRTAMAKGMTLREMRRRTSGMRETLENSLESGVGHEPGTLEAFRQEIGETLVEDSVDPGAAAEKKDEKGFGYYDNLFAPRP